MKMLNITSIFILLAVSLIMPDLHGENIVVRKIEFRGIRGLDKYEVIRSAGGAIHDQGIAIDTDKLKKVLNGSVQIENYTIENVDNVLVITVDEKFPLFMIVISDDKLSVPLMVDKKRNILHRGEFFSTGLPIIVMKRDFFENESNGGYIDGLLENLLLVSNSGGSFARELSEVEVLPGGDLNVKLKVRRTEFLIRNESNGFKKIEKSAAYLDSLNYYPARLDLREKRVLVR